MYRCNYRHYDDFKGHLFSSNYIYLSCFDYFITNLNTAGYYCVIQVYLFL